MIGLGQHIIVKSIYISRLQRELTLRNNFNTCMQLVAQPNHLPINFHNEMSTTVTSEMNKSKDQERAWYKHHEIKVVMKNISITF